MMRTSTTTPATDMMEDVYTFGGNPLDRSSQRRGDAHWLGSLLGDPKTRLLPLFELKPLVHDGAAALEWQSVAPWRPLIDGGATLVFLGLGDGHAHFALDASASAAPSAAGAATVDVRSLAASIAGGEAAILGEARALVDWHARHRFCARCGRPSEPASGGWVRRCPHCRTQHYPRVDPVVIMLAVKGERCLLGRGRRRVGSRYSCLAGFVEPGETLEEAVRREVFEEASVRVGRVRYLASQPWPFPSTLMVGMLAEALSEDITVDPEELAEARWFERDEVRAMVARSQSDEPVPGVATLPPPLAIGHQIARRWAFGIDAI